MSIAGLSVPVAAAGLGSAFFFAVAAVCKHLSAGSGPDAPRLGARSVGRFALDTARHPLWLVGTLADIVGLVLQVVALHLGALAVVQPLLLSGLVFALVLRGVVHRRLPVQQALWGAVVAAALGSFLVLSNAGPVTAHSAADRIPAVVCAVCGFGLVVVAVAWGSRSEAQNVRAGLMGFAAGTTYAATAALIKSLSDLALRGFVPFVAAWQLYALIVIGGAGLVIGQIAFQSGPMAAALPVASTVDPLLSIVIGVVIYDERLRPGPGHGVLLAVLVVILFAAVLRLAQLGDGAAPSRDPGLGVDESAAVAERINEPLPTKN